MKISVIGAGIGGLSAACLLAAGGHEITVFEKNEHPGGKMNEFRKNGYRFDTGPSLLTMPFILEKLFKRCGASFSEQVTLMPLSPLCRYFYPDGTAFDNYIDKKLNDEELRNIAPNDIGNYHRFLDYAARLYDKTADAFIFNPLFGLADIASLNLVDFFGIDAFKSVSYKVDNSFDSKYLKQFFKRFSTYNGSSPFKAPATLNVIPHVELNQGGYYVDGGLYTISKALHRLAVSLGVQFRFNCPVRKIGTIDGSVRHVVTEHQESHPADLVIANSDASETYLHLLDDTAVSRRKKRRIEKIEPSCSGFVMLLGVKKRYEKLQHHNVFFSADYKTEFRQIFDQRVMPDDPTIYIANTSINSPEHAPEGCSNLFVLINAPYLSPDYEWKNNRNTYGAFVIEKLENYGLYGLKNHIEVCEIITPQDFYDLYLSNRGSIYGTSSNSKLSAFVRPRNKSREVDGLYLVGGSTHPGGGIPLAVQSALNAVELIERYE